MGNNSGLEKKAFSNGAGHQSQKFSRVWFTVTQIVIFAFLVFYNFLYMGSVYLSLSKSKKKEKNSPPLQNSKSGCEKGKFAFIAATQQMAALQGRNEFPFYFISAILHNGYRKPLLKMNNTNKKKI